MAQIAMALISGVGQLAAGAAQQQMYNEQAAQAKLQGRSQAIAYRQQGADVLRNLNETLAATVAAAAAGGVDPTSGSAAALQGYARAEAYREYGTSLDNAELAKAGAAAQARIYQQAGRAAMTSAFFNFAGTMFSGIQRQLSLSPGSLG